MARYKRIGNMIRFKDGDREFWFDPSQLGTPAADEFKKWLDEGNEPDPDDTNTEPPNWRRLAKQIYKRNAVANRLETASGGKVYALMSVLVNQDMEDLIPTLASIRDSLGLTPTQLTNFNENVNEILSDSHFPQSHRLS